MKNLLKLAIACMIMAMASASFATDIIKIGVLAKRGPEKATKKWAATGEYLTAKLHGKKVEIVPLGFDRVMPAIKNGEVDFFLVNSSMYVTAHKKYGAQAIATVINSRQGEALMSFGGVIFTRADDSAITSLADIKGKRFMAVKKSSFGGWQMALKEFLDAGIDPYRDFASLEFGGSHDKVVTAVRDKVVDAGTVRTDTLERMAAGGSISMADFKIIHRQKHEGFPFVCSTRLYPEWPLARLKSTPEALAKEVASALKEIKPKDKAAKAAKIAGWTDPLDYYGVEELQKELKIGAYAL